VNDIQPASVNCVYNGEAVAVETIGVYQPKPRRLTEGIDLTDEVQLQNSNFAVASLLPARTATASCCCATRPIKWP